MTATTPRGAIVLGASGSVGEALVRALIGDRTLQPIVTLVRRSLPEQLAMAREAGVELREVLVPAMDASSLEARTREAVQTLEHDAVGFSVLGVGDGTSKLTIDQHRAIDVGLNAAFARGLAASGRVRHVAFMSSVGANPEASTRGSGGAGMPRYLRVKGESEEAVKASGLAIVSLFRPATIVGSRHTPRLLEKIAPAVDFVLPSKFRSITVDQIGRAMVAVGRSTPEASRVYHYAEMIALAP